MVVAPTAADWLYLGLNEANFRGRRQRIRHETNEVRFKAHYGADPESLAVIFVDLQTTQIAEARIARPSVLHFLMTFNWLTTYGTEPENSGKFQLDDKTVRTHVWRYVRAIAALKGQKIVWIDFNEEDEIFIITVDGVDCNIQEPRRIPMPRHVYQMRPEYKLYKKENFGGNYRNLQESIKVDKGKAKSDSDALAHDRRLHPIAPRAFQGYPQWGGSTAELLLKQDFDAGIALKKMPQALHKSHPEYLEFPLKVFRDHIHQENRSWTGRSYWLNRKKQENKTK